MDPKKTFATTDSASIDASLFELDPPVGQPSRTLRAPSIDLRRRSHSSLRSESNTRAPSPSPCATREIVGEDCALQRFIVWAAVKRNRSVRMPRSDRLKCPLVSCGQQFDDHEAMLRHLSKCRHLKTGEYLCYDCMKIERFNDEKCRGCLGHPTKRRRIINMAKSFFSNIGNKSRREGSQPNFQDDVAMPPPSYDSLVIDLNQQSEQRERERGREQQHHNQPQQEQQQERRHPHPRPQLELNGREIHELDSRQMFPTAQLDSVNYDTRSEDMPEASGRHDKTHSPMPCQHTNSLSKRRDPSSHRHKENNSMPPPNFVPSDSGSRRPSLALDTHMDRYRSIPRAKRISPSSSLRSTRSSHGVSPITPWSTDSSSAGPWTLCSSIDTAMTSPITPFSPTDLPPTSHPESILNTTKDANTCPDDDCNYMVDNLPELPGDDSLSIPRGMSDPLSFCFDPKDNYSWMQSVNTEISLATSVNMMFTDSNPKPTSMPPEFLEQSDRGLETRTLVESAWDTIQEHVSSSLLKLSQIQGNPLVDRLRTYTTKAVALTGLSSLRSVLQGNTLTDPFECICFIHLIYAFSLILHENELETRCNSLYRQAMAYRHSINPAHAQEYTYVVTTIWQPTIPSGGSSNRKGKEPEYRTEPKQNADTDALVMVGQNFLDDVENAAIAIHSNADRPIEVVTSELWSTHLMEFQPQTSQNSPFIITVDYIISVLSTRFTDSKVLLPKLREVGQSAHTGIITTVRKLELAILQAGKTSLESSDLFDEFIPQVRRLCDPIYLEQGFHSRTRYQTLGVSLVEALIQNMASGLQRAQEGPETFQLGLTDPDSYNEFLDNLHETFDEPDNIEADFLAHLGTGASQQSQTELSGTQSFETSVDSITIQGIGSSARQAGTSKSFVAPIPSHTRAPSESFSASPGLPRRTAVPSPPKSSTPTPAGLSPRPLSSVSSTSHKVEANDACELCGYRPKGDPQWFKGSMAKHKKMQHSAGPPIIYKCPYPGCNSQYKNRQDNLRQHQIEKNHFVGDEATRRPSKRKKI
ncbi:uncharacterized protein F4822DRAFT_431376 [Hypoxylon trugodes]|uniref:uncharacterized protein n=1 Tax=Hypoxylon trugodes TaxID=326681 RepID=UPI002192521F|nr:uncharacterized protein F4822DRAFT_431376 [Hypoxylon trugodes]KAI1386503.1 hypothetical protein F4822DRAFT_431376 [Hypoxylon trugodes]